MAACEFVEESATAAGTVYRCARCRYRTPPVRVRRVLRTCDDPTATPAISPPGQTTRVANYATALARWNAAGRPTRTDAEVTALFETHCAKCPYYAGGLCRHETCGCNVRPADAHHPLAVAAALIGADHPTDVLTNKLAWKTENCPIGKWPEPPPPERPRWVTLADRARATAALAQQVPPTVTAVAGVSRSGMAPAGQLAELLHLRLHGISLEAQLVELPHGWRFRGAADDDGDLLIVDDTVASGASMRQLREYAERHGRRKIWYAATYASDEARQLVDFAGERLPLPHYLEWNFFNSVYSPHTALDFDGVLCRDCLPEEVFNLSAYDHFLRTAEPLFLPRRCVVPLIVTARLEAYRELTTAWLARWGVTVDRLVMGPWRSAEERRDKYDAAEFKGRVFRESECSIFVESCPLQARAIAAAAPGKTVICPASREVWT